MFEVFICCGYDFVEFNLVVSENAPSCFFLFVKILKDNFGEINLEKLKGHVRGKKQQSEGVANKLDGNTSGMLCFI